jgi:hypothetical protein
MVEKLKEGWGYRPGTSKERGDEVHYFVNDVSLCFSWHFYGEKLEQDLSPKCAECAKNAANRKSTG